MGGQAGETLQVDLAGCGLELLRTQPLTLGLHHEALADQQLEAQGPRPALGMLVGPKALERESPLMAVGRVAIDLSLCPAGMRQVREGLQRAHIRDL